MLAYDFSGKSAVVTGAGGGMGEAIALALAKAGAKVTAIDMKGKPDSLAAAGDRIHFAQGDLRDLSFVEKTIAGANQRAGRLDYLANVAGVLWFGRDKSALEMDLGVWDEVMAINLKTMVHTARAAVPFMRKSGGGAMVHVSTIQALRGEMRPQDAYAASKAALIALSRSIAVQYAARAVRSNVILPGPTLTPMQERWQADESMREAVADFVPLRRIGRPEDMAQASLFLLSDQASFITGTELIVDGGLTARL